MKKIKVEIEIPEHEFKTWSDYEASNEDVNVVMKNIEKDLNWFFKTEGINTNNLSLTTELLED